MRLPEDFRAIMEDSGVRGRKPNIGTLPFLGAVAATVHPRAFFETVLINELVAER